MKLENKALFDELMEIADGLIENARRLQNEVAFTQKYGNAFSRLKCGRKLGEAAGCTAAASKIVDFAGRLIDA